MDNLTTLVCLFHHDNHAQQALKDLRNVGLPESAISVIGGDGATVDDLDKSELASLGMPDRDYDHLKHSIRNGDIVVAVSSIQSQVAEVERIFADHRAKKIDDVEAEYKEPVAAIAQTGLQTDEASIPVVEEDLVVGKRTVDQGGVRLYRRIVEIPVEESVQLREEHVNVDRIAVDRPVTNADLAFQDRTVELTETAEEVVVAKEARVVEEIVLSKDATSHVETVHDTVRHTEVEIEELPGTGANAGKTQSTY